MRILILLLLLTGCGTFAPPSLPAALPITYANHQEGHPNMPWTLDIYTPDGQTLKTSRSNINPGGVFGDFTWRDTPEGGNIDLKFPGIAPLLGLSGRVIVKLTVNGQPQFTGPVVETPGRRDSRSAQVSVGGAVQLLSRRVVDDTLYENRDIGFIVRDLISRFRHPAISYDPALIPNTGQVLSKFSTPYLTLDKALDTLSKSTASTKPIPFGVLGDGRFYFGAQVGPGTMLAYRDLKAGLDWLPVSADDVVTQATLVALTGPSGAFPRNRDTATTPAGGYQNGVVYPPMVWNSATLTGTVTDAAHATYQAQLAAIPPAGADLLTYSLAAPSFTEGVENEAWAHDGNGSTYAQNATVNAVDPATGSSTGTGASVMQFEYNVPAGAERLIGYRLLYTTDDSVYGGYVYMNFTSLDGNSTGNAEWALPGTSGAMQEVTAILPPPTNVVQSAPGIDQSYQAILRVVLYPSPATSTRGALRIYELTPIYLSSSKVSALAASLLKLPAQVPAVLTVPGLLPAVPSITVTGAPGGDLSADVAEYEYQHGEKALNTTNVKLEQPGASETARILRLVAQDRAGNAQTDLRSYLGR